MYETSQNFTFYGQDPLTVVELALQITVALALILTIQCKGDLTDSGTELGKRRADIPAAASHIRELTMVVEMVFRDGDGSCAVLNG